MRLSAHDASFLYSETASGPMHGVTLSVLNGEVEFNEIFSFFEARIHLVPRLRQRLLFVPFNMAHPKWVDDPEFNLSNHLKLHEVPEGTSMEQAIEIALELGEPLLDRNKPLWLNYVIPAVENQTLLVQMGHHAFLDGATAVAMSTVLTTTEPDSPPPVAAEKWKPGRLPTDEELVQEAMTEQAMAFSNSLTQGFNSNPVDVQKTTAVLARLARPVMQAPWNAGAVGPKRKFCSIELTLDAFKYIRKSLGGTINDVAVSVVVESAARYMKAGGEFTDNQYLRLMCPVDARPPGDNPLEMEGNQVSGMFPILEARPKSMAARYVEVKQEMKGIKERGEAETLHTLQSTQPNFPPVMMAPTRFIGTPLDPTQAQAENPQPVPMNPGLRPQQFGFNFTVTNIPGPTWTQYVAGLEVLRSIGTLMLGGNLGLGVSIVSYNGKMSFCFTADPRLMPDLNGFSDLVQEAFDELTTEAKTRQASA